MDNKCLICGKEIPLDETQLLTYVGNKFFTICMCHEGTEEEKRLRPLIEETVRLYKQNEAYKNTIENIKHSLKYSNVNYYNRDL
jgi:transcription elongation factor GreA-like protein